jgi:hypothetical protein
MKTSPPLFFLAFCAFSLQAADSQAPEMTIHFPLSKDSRHWVIADSLTNGAVGSVVVITRGWVPQGDSIEAWKEMFDEKTMLTKASVREHIDAWKRMLARVDPKAEVKEDKAADDTIIVSFTSIAADETGISRYFKASDGIYVLSYRVRPKLKSEETLRTWRDIISSATLVSNSVK